MRAPSTFAALLRDCDAFHDASFPLFVTVSCDPADPWSSLVRVQHEVDAFAARWASRSPAATPAASMEGSEQQAPTASLPLCTAQDAAVPGLAQAEKGGESGEESADAAATTEPPPSEVYVQEVWASDLCDREGKGRTRHQSLHDCFLRFLAASAKRKVLLLMNADAWLLSPYPLSGLLPAVAEADPRADAAANTSPGARLAAALGEALAAQLEDSDEEEGDEEEGPREREEGDDGQAGKLHALSHGSNRRQCARARWRAREQEDIEEELGSLLRWLQEALLLQMQPRDDDLLAGEDERLLLEHAVGFLSESDFTDRAKPSWFPSLPTLSERGRRASPGCPSTLASSRAPCALVVAILHQPLRAGTLFDRMFSLHFAASQIRSRCPRSLREARGLSEAEAREAEAVRDAEEASDFGDESLRQAALGALAALADEPILECEENWDEVMRRILHSPAAAAATHADADRGRGSNGEAEDAAELGGGRGLELGAENRQTPAQAHPRCDTVKSEWLEGAEAEEYRGRSTREEAEDDALTAHADSCVFVNRRGGCGSRRSEEGGAPSDADEDGDGSASCISCIPWTEARDDNGYILDSRERRLLNDWKRRAGLGRPASSGLKPSCFQPPPHSDSSSSSPPPAPFSVSMSSASSSAECAVSGCAAGCVSAQSASPVDRSVAAGASGALRSFSLLPPPPFAAPLAFGDVSIHPEGRRGRADEPAHTEGNASEPGSIRVACGSASDSSQRGREAEDSDTVGKTSRSLLDADGETSSLCLFEQANLSRGLPALQFLPPGGEAPAFVVRLPAVSVRQRPAADTEDESKDGARGTPAPSMRPSSSSSYDVSSLPACNLSAPGSVPAERDAAGAALSSASTASASVGVALPGLATSDATPEGAGDSEAAACKRPPRGLEWGGGGGREGGGRGGGAIHTHVGELLQALVGGSQRALLKIFADAAGTRPHAAVCVEGLDAALGLKGEGWEAEDVNETPRKTEAARSQGSQNYPRSAANDELEDAGSSEDDFFASEADNESEVFSDDISEDEDGRFSEEDSAAHEVQRDLAQFFETLVQVYVHHLGVPLCCTVSIRPESVPPEILRCFTQIILLRPIHYCLEHRRKA
ncbi:hypothetical protein BESB_002760 [Besnoitia besnoiti]|uniref:Uncharacterized protein n=1 Tax=Besnoitia besnoiti TaxID=94643 RepID=A0A2A9MIY4_BESBE|nr:hypothetical protein BESB_002760 [Besnoitia besnoiti]PFH37935.1 hypothetical protein BESB_002760 [Besnoitia besnoiti]